MLNIGDLIPNNWSNTQIDKSDRGSKEKRFCINWHEVSKDHWEKFTEGIITKCSERKLEMHIQELLEKNYSSDMEDTFLQDAIDKIWMRILAIILNSCIDNLPITGSRMRIQKARILIERRRSMKNVIIYTQPNWHIYGIYAIIQVN